MPIKIQLQGTPAESGVQTGFVLVATGTSTRLETTVAHPAGGREAAEQPSPYDEPQLGPDAAGKVLADVHLVWRTGGLMLEQLPTDAGLHHDGGNDLTRLTFSGVTLTLSAGGLVGAKGWSSGALALRCTPGEGDQLLTGYLCRPGVDLTAAVATTSLYLSCPARPLSLWEKLLRMLFG